MMDPATSLRSALDDIEWGGIRLSTTLTAILTGQRGQGHGAVMKHTLVAFAVLFLSACDAFTPAQSYRIDETARGYQIVALLPEGKERRTATFTRAASGDLRSNSFAGGEIRLPLGSVPYLTLTQRTSLSLEAFETLQAAMVPFQVEDKDGGSGGNNGGSSGGNGQGDFFAAG